MRNILGQIASPKKGEFSEEETKELMRVLNEEVVSESGGSSTMESESDKILGCNSIHYDSRLFFYISRQSFIRQEFPPQISKSFVRH